MLNSYKKKSIAVTGLFHYIQMTHFFVQSNDYYGVHKSVVFSIDFINDAVGT